MPRRIKDNPNDFFIAVKTHFAEYERFRPSKKNTVAAIILLVDVRGNGHVGRCEMDTAMAVGPSAFEGWISARDGVGYALRIFCNFYGKAPCMRFDSRGVYHNNREYGSGLPGRQIAPPHFHKVDSDGWMRAYHACGLKQKRVADAISKDITLGIKAFRQEFNLSSPSGGLVVLKKIAVSARASTPGAMDAANFP